MIFAGGGFAMMAWNLAQDRTFKSDCDGPEYTEFHSQNPNPLCPHCQYGMILAKAALEFSHALRLYRLTGCDNDHRIVL